MGGYLNFINLGTGSKVVDVVGSRYGSCAILDTSSEVHCWGYNANGELVFIINFIYYLQLHK